jgi:cytochrome P450
VSRTLFGHDVANDTDDVARAMATFQSSAARPDILPGWVPTPHRRKVRHAIAALDRIMYGMIERRRAQPSSANLARTDLLQMLVSAVDEEGDGGHMSEREVRDQLVTLFLAGHETTSHALTWTWYLLAKNPEVSAKLHAEVDTVLGGRAATYEDLPKLKYTAQVLEEAMRLYPPAYLVGRMAHEDTEIGGYPVRAGSEVIVWIYMTHHDARWFPRPEAFEPERFSEENAAKIPKFAYVPFGAGPRACIGKSFAMLEGQLILATLAQGFTLAVHEGQRVAIHPRITLSPKHGMRMKLRAR